MKKGFTLVEMLFAVAIFVSVVTMVSTIFVHAIRGQRRNLAYQELLDQTSYVMEYMSRSIRMARRDDFCAGTNSNYVTSTIALGIECLLFTNYKDECQYFCFHQGDEKLMVATTTSPTVPPAVADLTDLTSPELQVSPLGAQWIELSGETQTDTDQPLVTILLQIEGREQSSIQIRTSISQRNLDM